MSLEQQREIDEYYRARMKKQMKKLGVPIPGVDDPWPFVPAIDPTHWPSPRLPVIEPVTENDTEIILDRVLSDSNIVVRKRDPDYLRYFIVKVKGWFVCPKCYHKWICCNASVKVDLLEMEVKMYKQICRGGGPGRLSTVVYCKAWAELCLTKEEFEVIAKTVIQYYKQRRKAGEIVPFYEFKNTRLDKRKATRVHSEDLCERCLELGEPCWLYLVPIVKPVPQATSPSFALTSLSASLKTLHANIRMDKDESGKDCIHILPSKESSSIKKWRLKCEAIVVSFLKNRDHHTVSVQPDMIPKLNGVMKEAKSKPSVYLEKETVLHVVAATKQDVDELLRKVKHIESIIAKESRNKTKPCIILC